MPFMLLLFTGKCQRHPHFAGEETEGGGGEIDLPKASELLSGGALIGT